MSSCDKHNPSRSVCKIATTGFETRVGKATCVHICTKPGRKNMVCLYPDNCVQVLEHENSSGTSVNGTWTDVLRGLCGD
jgi:hypothetical protein